MMFKLNNEDVIFNICRSMEQCGEVQLVFAIMCKVESVSEVQIEERFCVESLEVVMMYFESENI